MTVLKIGILTMHRCINYGSYWQTHYLVNGLRRLGHNVTVLDHESTLANLAEWRCAYRPVLPAPIPQCDYPEYRKKIVGFFKAIDELPLSARFAFDTPGLVDDYDMVIVGSDEVWNVSHPWYGKYPLFFGEGLQDSRLVSYAASFGNYPAELGLDPSLVEKLRWFESVSVRDRNSQVIIMDNLDIEPELVLDPCLQFTIGDVPGLCTINQPYVAVYGHNFSDSFVQKIRSWASSENLQLISIGYRNEWADRQWLSADPFAFWHFMARCQVVVTNFFHGCVFALINRKPFGTEASPYRSQKINGLLMSVNATDRIVGSHTSASTLSGLLSTPLGRDSYQRIEALRQNSWRFLEGALTSKHRQVV